MENLLPLSLFAIGLSLVAMELAVPGLYLAALGLGAIASALVGYFYSSDPSILFVSLCLISASAYLFMSSSRSYLNLKAKTRRPTRGKSPSAFSSARLPPPRP